MNVLRDVMAVHVFMLFVYCADNEVGQLDRPDRYPGFRISTRFRSPLCVMAQILHLLAGTALPQCSRRWALRSQACLTVEAP